MIKMLDLFAGSGGFTLAAQKVGGFETVAFCEIDDYAQKVLRKNWPDVPVFSDVTKLRGEDVGAVDLITGGFPCQDLSAAGKGKGIGEGTRSGLFREILRIAQELDELPYLVLENVPRLLSGPSEDPGQWFGEFLWSLAEIGYDAEWFCISAASVGAPHLRERVWIVTYPDTAPDERGCISRRVYEKHANIDGASSWWQEWGGGEPEICGMDDGIPNRSHRLGLMGNAIVPQVAEIVLEAVKE